MEWSTPEVTSPFDVVRYLSAGDHIVRNVAASLEAEERDVVGVFCSRANVDYLSGTLWAAHESYLHDGRAHDLRGALPEAPGEMLRGEDGGFLHVAPSCRQARNTVIGSTRAIVQAGSSAAATATTTAPSAIGA